MPIILLIVSTLAFWTLYWFVQMGGNRSLPAPESPAQGGGAAPWRRAKRARVAPLRAVDDPRDAVAILMVLIARANGDPTREQIAAIEGKLRNIFGFERELPERMTQARFIARQADSFEQAAAVFRPLFPAAAHPRRMPSARRHVRGHRATRGAVRDPDRSDCGVETDDRAGAGALDARDVIAQFERRCEMSACANAR
jgi:hypothetical protein